MFQRRINDELSLALVQPSFAQRYWDIVSEQRDYLGQWLSWPYKADSKVFFQAFVQRALEEYAHGRSMTCAMVYQNDIVGNISFNRIDSVLQKAEIGYWLRRDLQGNGIVTLAVKEMIKIAFDELHLTKVQISCATDNAPSRAVCERLGFQLEGVITQAELVGERLLDHAVYGLIKS